MLFEIDKFYKVVRYFKIYGLQRTLIKVFGRKRINFGLWYFFAFPNYIRTGKKVGIIGCGHHAFSSIAFFLTKYTNCKIIWAFDTDIKAAKSFSSFYKVPKILEKATPHPDDKPLFIQVYGQSYSKH